MERLRNRKARLISHKSILRNSNTTPGATLNTEMEAAARDNSMQYIAVREEAKQRGKSVAHHGPFEFRNDADRGSRPRFGSAPNDGASVLTSNDDDVVTETSETSSRSSSVGTGSVYNEKMAFAATAEIEETLAETKAKRARKRQADKEYRNR